MTKDQFLTRLLSRRRALLVGAAAVGAAGTAGLFAAGTGDTSKRPVLPAAGPRRAARSSRPPTASSP